MDNNLVRLKLRQRLNKLASNDFTNLECWQEAELINKGLLQFTRRNLHGGNQYHEGDEQSIVRVDDFQILLTDKDLKGSNRGLFFETEVLPDNYMKFKRVSVTAYTKTCSDPRRITVSLVEEANVDEMLIDFLLKPSFKWAETFCTLAGNKIKIYTNDDFIVKNCKLTYYTMPTPMVIAGCRDWNDNTPTVDVPLQFKDDIVELIIDEAVSIAAADMNDFNNFTRETESVEKNN